MNNFFIGIDPGINGGLAVIDHLGCLLCCVPMPIKNGEVDSRMLAAYLNRYLKEGECFAVLEKVGAMPGQGVCAMFTFGKNVGEIKAALKICKIPYQEVTPEGWKSEILKGLPWKAQTSRFKAPKGASPKEIAILKEQHKKEFGAGNNKAKKDAKLIACTFIERRFPNLDIRMGKKNPHDGMAEALCMALFAKKMQIG